MAQFTFAPAACRLALALGGLSVSLIAGAPRAFAALDAAGSWSSENLSSHPSEPRAEESQQAPWNLWQSHIDSTAQQSLLEDSEKRIPELFGVPDPIRSQVTFWLDVYTRYSSREAILFDEEHPEIVYEVVDFRNLARTSRNRAAYEIVSRQVLRERVQAYQKAFLALKKKKKNRSREESQILSVVRGLPHSHNWLELKKNLRVQWGQRDQVIQGLLASAPYRQRMDHVFEAMGLPKELTLLSLVESSFNPKALSHAGAAGVWQFMPDSGAEFLRVLESQGIDERVSPIKSTVAAARLLQRNFKMLGSWPAAISAYNHGHGKWVPVPRAERLAPGRVLAQCSKSRRLPTKLGFASRNYYAEFLALLRAERYQHKVFGPPPHASGQSVRFVAVGETSRLESLAEAHGLAPHQLLSLNPDILAANAPIPSGFLLAVPALEDDLASVIQASRQREREFRASRSPSRAARRSALQAQAAANARGRRG